MGKRALFVIGLFVLGSVFAGTKLAQAQSFHAGNDVAVPAGQTIDGSVYLTGRTINVAGEVNGDVYCAGQDVSISGTIHGDVICAGQNIDILGSVDGSVRVIGQNVTLSQTVGHNVSVAGQLFTLNSSAKIIGDLSLAANSATLNGNIGRDLSLAANNVSLNGVVGRNVTGTVNSLTLDGSSLVKGNLSYRSNNDANLEHGSVVDGKVTRTVPPAPGSNNGAFFAFRLGWAVFVYFTFVVFALMLTLLFPTALHSTAKRAQQQPLKTFLLGLLAAFLLPITAVVLMVTLIGFPLGLLLLGSWLLLSLLTGPFFGYYLGRLLVRRSTNPIVIVFVGSSVLVVLSFIPIVSFFVVFIAYFSGLGMILLQLRQHVSKPQYELK